MSTKNLARDVESIALALSEEGGYEYYHIDDDLRELAKDVSDMQTENAKLRELVRYIMHQCNDGNPRCDECIDWNDGECVALLRMRELGVEVDR